MKRESLQGIKRIRIEFRIADSMHFFFSIVSFLVSFFLLLSFSSFPPLSFSFFLLSVYKEEEMRGIEKRVNEKRVNGRLTKKNRKVLMTKSRFSIVFFRQNLSWYFQNFFIGTNSFYLSLYQKLSLFPIPFHLEEQRNQSSQSIEEKKERKEGKQEGKKEIEESKMCNTFSASIGLQTFLLPLFVSLLPEKKSGEEIEWERSKVSSDQEAKVMPSTKEQKILFSASFPSLLSFSDSSFFLISSFFPPSFSLFLFPSILEEEILLHLFFLPFHFFLLSVFPALSLLLTLSSSLFLPSSSSPGQAFFL